MAAKQHASRAVRSFGIAIVVTVGIVAALLLFMVLDDGGADLSYKTLDYDVQVQSNGDLKVTQHIDMKLADRSDDDGDHPWKQLYQQYTLKGSDLTNITDISVRNVTTGETYQQGDIAIPSSYSTDEWNREHAKQWYIADVSQGDSNPQPFDPAKDGLVSGNTDDRSKKIEIGWNIPSITSASSLKFDVTMTMQGVTTAYQDMATFQWEPLGVSNQIPIGKVTGTVTFPEGIDADNSWAWLHTECTSETERDENGSLKFTVYDVRAGDYVDVVAMFDVGATGGVEHTRDTTIKNGIMKSEAKQEQQWRDQQRKQARIRLITWIAIAVVGLVLCVIAIIFALRSFNRSQYHGGVEYWRDEPEMSPASAAELLHMVDNKHSSTLTSRKMSASVLSLASRGAIAIYPGVAAMYRGIDMSQANNADIARMIANDPARIRDVGKTSTVVILPVVFDNVQSLPVAPERAGRARLAGDGVRTHRLSGVRSGSDEREFLWLEERLQASGEVHEYVRQRIRHAGRHVDMRWGSVCREYLHCDAGIPVHAVFRSHRQSCVARGDFRADDVRFRVRVELPQTEGAYRQWAVSCWPGARIEALYGGFQRIQGSRCDGYDVVGPVYGVCHRVRHFRKGDEAAVEGVSAIG